MGKRFKILIVDDEFSNIDVISAALEDEYDIFTAMNGHDAVSQLKQHTIELILLDVIMPDINGFEVCKIIKANPLYVDIPVIFLTALDSREGTRQGLDVGAVDYLTKPVDLDLLKLRVRNHTESKERSDLIKEQRDLLEAALARIKRLEGIIPICMYCKKIRDDQNSWHQLETYISQHSEAMFSHGACPDCAKEQMRILKNL